jgi:hypothetical protein
MERFLATVEFKFEYATAAELSVRGDHVLCRAPDT